MKVVILKKANVTIKRKKAQPSKGYSTVGNKDNKVLLIFEHGEVFLKVFNPNTGLVYIYSKIRSNTNPALNLTDAKGLHLILLNPSLKPEPSPYIFIFESEEDASVFNACVSLAVKAAKGDELLYDAETNVDSDDVSVRSNTSESSNESGDLFNPTQDFNVGAQELSQELLASYK